MWARHWIPDEICIQGFTTMRQRIRDPFFCCRALGWNWTWHAYELVMPHPKRKKQTKKKHNFQNVWSLENKITYCKKTHVLHFDDFHLLKYVSPYFSGKLFTVDKQILFLKWVLQPCSTTNFFLNFSKWLWTISVFPYIRYLDELARMRRSLSLPAVSIQFPEALEGWRMRGCTPVADESQLAMSSVQKPWWQVHWILIGSFSGILLVAIFLFPKWVFVVQSCITV